MSDEKEGPRGRAVRSSHEESRWHGDPDDPLSSGDGEPGGWNGGHDQGDERPGAAGELSGVSGDSVRTQGVASATSESLGRQGAGATTGGKPPPSADGAGEG